MVHFQLSGREVFRAPTRSDAALRREREEFETFGERGKDTRAAAEGNDSHVEKWRLVDESAGGMRVTRPLKEGARIGAGMMVAVQTTDSPRYTLGNVRWALREGEGALAAGIQLFAGEAHPVAIRIVEPGATGHPWRHRGHDGPETAPAEAVPRARSRRRVRALQLLRLNPVRREYHAERRAPAGLAVDLQHRLMPLQHMLDDGQAESGAAGVP